ncbi:threonylcarbamoyl-AMP synthase [Spirochaetales bacterium BR193]|uniref:Threonylcarbamoyl-AMP synthase n=1 Tax=Entomospira entomophila TaxID=2719988 RepID=A0A968KS74_9SPIO|nr:threonylcarbamoyl-AMP synthase [Entomospira entomophilus]
MNQTRIIGMDQLEQAVESLAKAEVVAMPTETVYGLAGDATSDQACREIFAIKGRAMDNPLISHFAHYDQLISYAPIIPSLAKDLFTAFSPGPLTIVLPASRHISAIATAGLSTFAVRIPMHPVAQELIRRFDRPLVAPSANLSGRYSSTSAQMVYDQLAGRIPLIIDGGVSSNGLESTVVLVQESSVTILRYGSITPTMLADVIGSSRLQVAESLRKSTESGERCTDAVVLSPGMKYAHYQPQVPLQLFRSTQALHLIQRSESVMVLMLGDRPLPHPDQDYLRVIRFDSVTEYAQKLYESFALADRLGVEQLMAYYDTHLGEALCDRLLRAAAYRFLS